jgi:hypothetical protein
MPTDDELRQLARSQKQLKKFGVSIFDSWTAAKSTFEGSPSGQEDAIAQAWNFEGLTIGRCTEEIDVLRLKALKPSFKEADFNKLKKNILDLKKAVKKCKKVFSNDESNDAKNFLKSIEKIFSDCNRVFALVLAKRSQERAMDEGGIDWKAALTDEVVTQISERTAQLSEYKKFEKDFNDFVRKYDLGSAAEKYPFRIWNALIFSLCQAGKNGNGLIGWKKEKLIEGGHRDSDGRWIVSVIDTDTSKPVRTAVAAQAMLQLQPFIEHAERHLDLVVNKLKSGREWAFWSGAGAKEAAKKETNGVVLEGTVGGWFDTVWEFEKLTRSSVFKKASGFTGEGTDSFVVWNSISELYARKAAENLESFKFKGFLGPGSSKDNTVFNNIEKPVMISVLEARAKVEPDIIWYVVDCEEEAPGRWTWSKKRSTAYKSRAEALKEVKDRYGS